MNNSIVKCFLSPTKKSIIVLLVFISFLRVTEQGVLIDTKIKPLYGPGDQVVVLNSTSLKSQIYSSPRAWVVEFYSSWCGHCIHFAPKFRQFAADLAGWQNIVAVSGIDCAEDDNVEICREYEIMGYPSIRFFEANSPGENSMINEEEGKKETKELNRGKDVERSENMADMKRTVIDILAKSLPNLFLSPSPVPNDETELWNQVKQSTKILKEQPSFLLVIFETENSFVGKEVTLYLSKHPSIRVIRFNKKNKIYDILGLGQDWPAAGYLKRDMSSGPIVLGKNLNLIDFLLKSVINLTGIPADLPVTIPSLDPAYVIPVDGGKDNNGDVLKEAGNIDEPASSNSNIVSMEDLIHAVRNSLRNEVGLLKQITGPKLVALKNYLHTLAEFFPADRRDLTIFLTKLSVWILPFEQLDNTVYLDKLTELEVEYHPWDIDSSTWGTCKGSIHGRRGYTCSLWSLFHTLTLIAYQKNQDFPVLDSIHGYIKEFFGCKDCSDHFTEMVADDGALMITPIKDQVLWLWRTHNKVNLRIKGGLSEDPAYPKILYPSEKQCSECYSKDTQFDEEKVLQYLIKVYSKPERTLEPLNFPPDHLSESKADNTYQVRKRGLSSALFTESDYWIFCIVYLSVAVLLVFAYLHFRARRSVDLISTLFCQKLTHSGKNNV